MKKSILLAEDESITALALKLDLQSLGYEIIKTVTRGADLISEALMHKPEIIITDIHLKDKITGLEAINRLRPELNSIMIVISGYNDPDSFEINEQYRPDSYLKKPITAVQLQDEIIKCDRHIKEKTSGAHPESTE